jgi:glyoxylase-like metal-dependent hydrolase (beta-lactamase superfamily II)
MVITMNDIVYTQLNIGQLSRNKFWGESDDRAYREAVCVSTLIELPDGGCVLVDLGLPYDRMIETIFNRRGISADKVTAIFLTHFHGDHIVDLNRYEGIPIYASQEEIALNGAALSAKVLPWEEGLFPGVKLFPLPGHTMGTAGLAFLSKGFRTLVAGDGVMTRDFFLAEEGFNNTVDKEALQRSIRRARDEFDMVVPGHDAQFLTGSRV